MVEPKGLEPRHGSKELEERADRLFVSVVTTLDYHHEEGLDALELVRGSCSNASQLPAPCPRQQQRRCIGAKAKDTLGDGGVSLRQCVPSDREVGPNRVGYVESELLHAERSVTLLQSAVRRAPCVKAERGILSVGGSSNDAWEIQQFSAGEVESGEGEGETAVQPAACDGIEGLGNEAGRGEVRLVFASAERPQLEAA